MRIVVPSRRWGARVVIGLSSMGGGLGCTDRPGAWEAVAEETGVTRGAIINGATIPDPSTIGMVRFEWTREVDSVSCGIGSGSLLTNDLVLTAAHVIWQGLESRCEPDTLKITMPDGAGNVQERQWPVTALPVIEQQPNERAVGRDSALVFVSSAPALGDSGPFEVSGSTTGFVRRLDTRATRTHYHETVTCFGYGASLADPTTGTILTKGDPTQGDFKVLPFPAFVAPNMDIECSPPPGGCGCEAFPDVAPCTQKLFSVVLGGGDEPAGTRGDALLPFSGDSGGPCIAADGRILGIVHGGRSTNAAVSASQETRITSAQAGAIGKFVTSYMPTGVSLSGDVNGGGLDTVSFTSSSGLLVIEGSLTRPGQSPLTMAFPTPIPVVDFGTGIPFSADLTLADFSRDGFIDVLAVVGGTPFYFEGASAFDFFTNQRTNYLDWFPPSLADLAANPIAFFQAGDFDGDGTMDAEETRKDGTVTLYFGEPGVGLTRGVSPAGALASLKGPSFDSDAVEDVAVGSPGSNSCIWDKDTLSCAAYNDVLGTVQIIPGDPTRAPYTLSDADFADEYAIYAEGDEPLHLEPHPRNHFGSALAWGTFFGSGDVLAVGIPDVTVEGVRRVGAVAFAAPNGDRLDPSALVPSVDTEDRLGAALASGDFNGDGRDDLAAGAPGPPSRLADTEPFTSEYVFLLYGAETVEAMPANIIGAFEAGDLTPPDTVQRWFGKSLATGDFNCDGFDDLAIGVPGAKVDGKQAAGAVVVSYGGPEGLRKDPIGLGVFDETLPELAGSAQVKAYFGMTLAAGNFDGDRENGRPCSDLAIGAPSRSVAGTTDGLVSIVYGGPSGLDVRHSQLLSQSDPAVPGTAEDTDRFGGGLSVSRLNTDGYDDLVVGSPGEGFGAGSVTVFEGGAAGLSGSPDVWQQGALGIPGQAEAVIRDPANPRPYLGFGSGDKFGSAVGGTSNGLVVVGAPYENHGDGIVEWSGAISLVATEPAPGVSIARAIGRLQSDLGGTLEEKTFFGAAITGPRINRSLEEASDHFDLTLFSSDGTIPPAPSVLFPAGDLGDSTSWLPLGVQVARDTELSSRGASSLEIRGTGVLKSPLFNPSALAFVGTSLRLDVQIPDAAPDPLTGAVEVRLTVPGALLVNHLVGRVELSSLDHGHWVHASFPLSDTVRAALYRNDPLSLLALSFTLPSGQAILVDNLRFVGHLQAAPAASCRLAVFGDHDYFTCLSPRSWSAARTLCQGVGMDLAALDTAAEDTFFTPRLLVRHFVGATDAAAEGTWSWSPAARTFWTGGPLGHAAPGAFAKWGLFQPATWLITELDCGAKAPLGLLGKWEARNCAEPNAFICEEK